MKYIRQFTIITALSFVGEILHFVIPLPIPASIYGILILFVCLELKIIKVTAIKETAYFLIEIMPLMFIPAAVGIMNSWQLVQNNVIAYIVLTFLTTVLVMAVSGCVTQLAMKISARRKER